MEYEKTGNFTANQRKLAKEIADRLKKLRKSGCTILVKCENVYAYKDEDMKHAQPQHKSCGSDYYHSVKSIDCGQVSDCGADDTEYFEKGYITD